MLERTRTAVVVIDMQESLFTVMHDREALRRAVMQLLQGAAALQLPVVATEQNPVRLGATLSDVAACMPAITPVAKQSFSCVRNSGFLAQLRETGCSQVLVCGMETHICVYQTAVELLSRGFAVDVVADAVSSRTAFNRRVGLERCRAAGAGVTSVETALFELLGSAEDAAFKAVAKIIK